MSQRLFGNLEGTEELVSPIFILRMQVVIGQATVERMSTAITDTNRGVPGKEQPIRPPRHGQRQGTCWRRVAPRS
jgi:hypothetical protein